MFNSLKILLKLHSSTFYFFVIRDFFMQQQPLVGQGLLSVKASRPHSETPHSVGLHWTSEQTDAETST